MSKTQCIFKMQTSKPSENIQETCKKKKSGVSKLLMHVHGFFFFCRSPWLH